jgi:hypothetical protein
MQESSLKVLESVNTFYSQAFSQLMSITLAMLAFVGILLPILFAVYQHRLFKLERSSVAADVKSALLKVISSRIEEFDAHTSAAELKLEEQLKSFEAKMEERLANATGGVFHVQGLTYVGNQQYLPAFESFIQAAIEHMKAHRENNLVRVLKLMSDDCLPRLNKDDLSLEHRWKENFDELIRMLDQLNKTTANGRYADVIPKLREHLRLACLRPAPPKA